MAGLEATFNYRRPGATLRSFSEQLEEEQFGPYQKPVQDMRGRSKELTLEGNGFALLDHPLEGVSDWYDAEHVKAVYYPSVRALVQRAVPQARMVFPVQHIARNEGDDKFLGPHHLVHNDFVAAFHERAASRFPGKFAALLRSHRLLVVNVWRNTAARPLRRNPLALCDKGTVDEGDLVATLLPNYGSQASSMANISHEVLTAKHSSRHQWYYCSDMARDEAVAFVTYDSHPEGSAFLPTLHTAIALPGQDAEAPRESCEVRVFCLLPLPPSPGGEPPAAPSAAPAPSKL